MKQHRDLFIVVGILAVTFAFGWFLPLSADPRVTFSLGWLAAIAGLIGAGALDR